MKRKKELTLDEFFKLLSKYTFNEIVKIAEQLRLKESKKKIYG